MKVTRLRIPCPDCGSEELMFVPKQDARAIVGGELPAVFCCYCARIYKTFGWIRLDGSFCGAFFFQHKRLVDFDVEKKTYRIISEEQFREEGGIAR